MLNGKIHRATVTRADLHYVGSLTLDADLMKAALWRQLPAVKAGHVFPVPSGAASLGTALELITKFDAVLTKLAG